MIILDSNILKGTSLRGPEAELLRVIRTAGVETVVAPWIVLEELAAQQVLAYAAKYEAAEAAMLKLKAATPWGSLPLPRRSTPERVRDHWRGRYAEIVGTLPTSPRAYEQALFREANLLAPCKTVNSGKHKTGARDAAIWLTAVEYAREHPQEQVYFVSNNTEDFGDGTSFPPLMDQDLQGVEGRFVLFTSLDGLLTKFAAESLASEAELTSLLRQEESLSDVARIAGKGLNKGRGLAIDADDGEFKEVMVRRWIGNPDVDLDSVSDIRSHEIAGHQWSTATARWLLSGYARIFGRGRYQGDYSAVACSWETRVLVSPTAPHKGLTVLRKEPTVPLGPEDESGTALRLMELSKAFADSGAPLRTLSRMENDLKKHLTERFNLRWVAEIDADGSRFDRLTRLKADELFDDE
ncbi:PIN domain-containing protein [Streptomyces niveus]|uniref:PIN domain-containing protein n=1 Tax=Streptomyces niveus TaxID=193462 RepID=UPI0036D9D868